jgi:hypothetical protein
MVTEVQTEIDIPARAAPSVSRRALAAAGRPAGVAVLVLVVYAAIALTAASLHGSSSFIGVGTDFSVRSHASREISSHLHPHAALGYDGQFNYFIALDPVRAHLYMDLPGYRYSHIVYPMLARAIALGRADWVADALLFINVLAVAAGTYLVARLLVRSGRPATLAFLYAAFPGVLLSFETDVSEPLAYALVALGLLLLADWHDRRAVALAALVFAIAGLTRESTLLVPVAVALVHVLSRDKGALRRAVGFVASATLPYAAWIAFLHWWLGPIGSSPVYNVGLLPFSGLEQTWPPRDFWPVLSVAVPVGILCVVCLIRARAEYRNPLFVALAASLVAYGLYLPGDTFSSYWSAGRLEIGAVLLALATIRSLTTGNVTTRLTVAATVLAYLPVINLVYSFIHLGYAPIQPR